MKWWATTFGNEEAEAVSSAIRAGNISQGEVTSQFEHALAKRLGVKHVVATSSGSTALTLSLMAVGVGPGKEVIVPNRTWIATAHAASILGAKVILVDVEPERPCIDVGGVKESITDNTQAIIVVHLNGRAADLDRLKEISRIHGVPLIEDAAQALGSRNTSSFLGTDATCGCFSLSVAKTIATGQGGFITTNNDELQKRLRAMRTHGVENVKDPGNWVMVGSNFRFTDIAAAIGLVQLERLAERLKKANQVYNYLESELCDGENIKRIPLKQGLEGPVYNEFLFERREHLIRFLEEASIESRRSYPSLNSAPYYETTNQNFSCSIPFERSGLVLPSGPSQNESEIEMLAAKVKSFYGR